MTPTPEDIALAEELNSVIWQDVPAPIESRFAQLIAAHTAPLRELAEIGRLAVELARAAQALDFGTCSAKGDELGKASAAYLAKQESKP